MPKVLLGDVARERKETYKGGKAGYPIVGLEHLVPEEITLTAWNEDSENTFSKMFHKGDILFGRRRAYLKKAAVAPFDGICSGDITVIEANADRIVPELLPFIIQNDALFDFAVGKSAGSLSPRVKWEHLRNYEFELPEMAKQRELAELLWAMDATKKSYEELTAATGELVKSQYTVMFGDPVSNSQNRPLVRLESLGTWQSGGTPSRENQEYYKGSIDWFSAGEVNEMYLKESNEKNTEEAVAESSAKLFSAGSMLLGMYDTAAFKMGILTEDASANQACANILPNDKVNIIWLYYTLQIMREHFLEQRRGCRQKNLNLGMIKGFEIPYVELPQQEEFITVAEQGGNAIHELSEALTELKSLYKRVIEENLVRSTLGYAE